MGDGPERRPVGAGGGFFILQARMPAAPSISDVAGYAAFGALYFLVSAVWLSVRDLRGKAARPSHATT